MSTLTGTEQFPLKMIYEMSNRVIEMSNSAWGRPPALQ